MGEMVWPERGTVWDTNWQIGKDGQQAVGCGVLESKIVGDLVDGEEQVLVGGGAHDVGNSPERQGEEGRVSKEVGGSDLDSDDEEDDVLRQGFVAAELGDLEDGLLVRESCK